MTKFSRISCIALTWNAAGECRGVLVRGRGERLSVQARWQARADASATVAECLAEGLSSLGGGDSVLVVAGAADAACGLAEVSVPALKATELRGALGFEVARNCPLGMDRVAWSYRRLPMNSGTRLPIRLFYLRQTAWEQWLESVSGLRLDALIPPQAALDPVLAERDLVLPTASGECFLFARTAKEGRCVRPSASEEDAFGSGAEPLAWDRLSLGPLAGLPAEEQATYAPALVLGAFGLQPETAKGQAEGFPVPYNLRPRRNQLNRFLAVTLALLLVVLSLVALWREYAARQACLTDLRAEVSRVKKEIDRRTSDSGKSTVGTLDALAKELAEADADLDRPSLASVLVELTETVGPNSWCYKFDWHDAAATIEIEESEEDVALVDNLELSPVIGDVLEESNSVSAGKVIRRLKLNARWDSDTDNPVPRKPDQEPADKDQPQSPPNKPEPDQLLPREATQPSPNESLPPGGAPPGVPPHLLKKEKP